MKKIELNKDNVDTLLDKNKVSMIISLVLIPITVIVVSIIHSKKLLRAELADITLVVGIVTNILYVGYFILQRQILLHFKIKGKLDRDFAGILFWTLIR